MGFFGGLLSVGLFFFSSGAGVLSQTDPLCVSMTPLIWLAAQFLSRWSPLQAGSNLTMVSDGGLAEF